MDGLSPPVGRQVTYGALLGTALGYAAVAIALGALARVLNIPFWFSALLSLTVYSGALQSSLLGLLATGASPLTMIALGLLLGGRHMLYGPHLARRHPDWSARERGQIAPFLTDEVYGLALDPAAGAGAIRWLAVTLYVVWQGATAAGYFVGILVPRVWLGPFLLALPSLFLGLLWPHLRRRPGSVAALVAVVLTAVLRASGGPSGLVIIPILAGMTAGFLLPAKREDARS